MKFLCKILFLFISLNVYGKLPVVESTTNGGNWSTNANWSDGSAPNVGGGSNVTYNINNTMTLTTTSFNLGSNSTLNICNTCTLTINGDMTFSNGSILNIPPGAVLIINGNVTNNNNSNQIYVDGLIQINGNFSGGNGSSLSSPNGVGSMNITGSVITDGTGSVFGSTIDCLTNCSSSAINPLPIELLDFYGEVVEEGIKLNWVTISEINNNYFTIYKYFNTNWVNYYMLNGAGNSLQMKEYEFIDSNPTEGYNLYKLRQTDFNGNYKEFKIISVFYEKNDSLSGIIVIPNPILAGDNINVEIIGLIGKEVLLVVNDMYGKTFFNKVIIVDVKSEIITINCDLESGVYIVVGSTINGLYSKKVIIK